MATAAMTMPIDMKRLGVFFLWSCLFLALLLALDQVFLRVPMKVPVLAEYQEFHLEFRRRLVGVFQPSEPAADKLQAPSAAPAKKAPAAKPLPASSPPAPRYLYVDDKGELHFADSLEEIPKAYRKEARPMAP